MSQVEWVAPPDDDAGLHVVWQDPPPVFRELATRRTASRGQLIAQQLRMNPGRWALLRELPYCTETHAKNLARAIRAGGDAAPSAMRAPGFDARAADRKVYVCWVGTAEGTEGEGAAE